MPELELAIRRLEKDPELKARWQRYHLISDAIKNNLPDSFDAGFSDRLRKAIDADASSVQMLTDPEVASLPAPSSSVTASSWYKPLVGFALAASVAFIAVYGLRTANLEGPGAAPSLASVGTPAQTAESPTAGTAAGSRQSLATYTIPTSPNDSNSRLNSYLVNHNEYLSTNSVHGMLPYVRMVGYEANR